MSRRLRGAGEVSLNVRVVDIGGGLRSTLRAHPPRPNGGVALYLVDSHGWLEEDAEDMLSRVKAATARKIPR